MGDNEANFLDNLALNLIIVPYNYSDLDEHNICVGMRTVVNFYYIYLWLSFTNIIMTIICSFCFLLLVFDWKYFLSIFFSVSVGRVWQGLRKFLYVTWFCPLVIEIFFFIKENWKGLVEEIGEIVYYWIIYVWNMSKRFHMWECVELFLKLCVWRTSGW